MLNKDKKKLFYIFVFFLIILITLKSVFGLFHEYKYKVDKQWKVGHSYNILVYPDNFSHKAIINIYDSDKSVILKDVMYSFNNEEFLYRYFIPTNTQSDRYTINITFYDFNSVDIENIIFQVNVKGMNFFEKVYIFLNSHLRFNQITDFMENFIYKITN